MEMRGRVDARIAQLGVATACSLTDRNAKTEAAPIVNRLDALEDSVALVKSPEAEQRGLQQAQGQPSGTTSGTFGHWAIIRRSDTSVAQGPSESWRWTEALDGGSATMPLGLRARPSFRKSGPNSYERDA